MMEQYTVHGRQSRTYRLEWAGAAVSGAKKEGQGGIRRLAQGKRPDGGVLVRAEIHVLVVGKMSASIFVGGSEWFLGTLTRRVQMES